MRNHLLALALLLTSTLSLAEEGNKSVLTLFKIEGDHGDKHSNVILSFDRNLPQNEVKITAHGSFLQVDLGDAIVPNSGEFVDLGGPYFKKAVAFQSGKSKGAARIFVDGKAEDMLELTKADVLGDKIIVSVAHSELQPAAVATSKGPAAQLQEASAAPAKDLLRGKLLTVSIFCAGMIGIFMLLFLLKPYLRKRMGRRTAEVAPEHMRTLSVHPLAPKQKLVLVQVGEEKLLLGLTSDAISYIKTIEPKTQAAPMANPVRSTPRPAPLQRPEANLQDVVNVARKAIEQPVVNQPTTTSVSHRVKKSSVPSKPMNAAEKILAKESKGAQLELSRPRAMVRKQDADKTNAVHDIKQLIRDKLKQMPQIS